MSDVPEAPLVTWRGNKLQVAFTKYADNDNTCVVLVNAEGGIEVKASVNLGPQPAHICYVKDYSENRGVLGTLVAARMLRITGHSIRNGSEEFVQCELTPWACALAGIESPEAAEAFQPQQGLPQDHGDVPPANIPPVVPPMTDAEIADEPDSATDFATMEAEQNAGLVEQAQRDAAAREAGAVPQDVHTQPAPEDIDAALAAGASAEGSGSPDPLEQTGPEDDPTPPAAA